MTAKLNSQTKIVEHENIFDAIMRAVAAYFFYKGVPPDVDLNRKLLLCDVL